MLTARPTTGPRLVRDALDRAAQADVFGADHQIVYLPILMLEGIEGKLFRPMALTVIFALLGSLFFSLTLMPVLASLLPRSWRPRDPPPPRRPDRASRVYEPISFT